MAKQITIFKGEAREIVINVKDKSCSSQPKPYDLADLVGASGVFQNDDDTTIEVAATIESTDLGKLKISLTDDQTELLKEGSEVNLPIKMQFSTGMRIFEIEEALEIKETTF